MRRTAEADVAAVTKLGDAAYRLLRRIRSGLA